MCFKWKPKPPTNHRAPNFPPNLVSEPRVEQPPTKLHLLVSETLPTTIQENGRRQRQPHRVQQDLRQGHEQHHRQMRAHKTGLLQIGGQPQSVANLLTGQCAHALFHQRRIGQVDQHDNAEHEAVPYLHLPLAAAPNAPERGA